MLSNYYNVCWGSLTSCLLKFWTHCSNCSSFVSSAFPNFCSTWNKTHITWDGWVSTHYSPTEQNSSMKDMIWRTPFSIGTMGYILGIWEKWYIWKKKMWFRNTWNAKAVMHKNKTKQEDRQQRGGQILLKVPLQKQINTHQSHSRATGRPGPPDCYGLQSMMRSLATDIMIKSFQLSSSPGL